ncbi:hypothetical protein B0H16DRAFT_1896910 [Mycena metata]|uniref:Uncharacterized protein n=1 Tax=Mycena metata TaxID=1033252 RepID=A0AAD7MJA7_9AGAR|nr:hypothetical protein B0H16DRAFT_1896910 [Mycena metata]
MVKFTFITIFAAIAANQSLALIFNPTSVLLAHEQGTDWIIAYDHNFSELARYYAPDNFTTTAGASPTVGGQCTDLSGQELKTLPAWPILEATAREFWGSGSYNLELDAYTCVAAGVVQIRLTGSPSCSVTTVNTGGTLVGASGTVTLTIASGYESTGIYSVTRSSTIAVGFEASVSVGVPGLGEAGASITTTTSLTNEVGRSFGTPTSNQITQSIQLNAPAGSTCKLSYNTENCYQSSNGQVAFLAQGWVWFNFNSPTHGHYKWALNMDAFTSEAQRSSHTDFTGAINGHSNGNYRGVCT